jgi:hypothetical protein
MEKDYIDGEFALRLNRREIVMIISVLGWVDALVPSDEAFKEYVGWPREECRSFADALADLCRSVPPETPG